MSKVIGYVVRGQNEDGDPAVYFGDGGFTTSEGAQPVVLVAVSQAIDAAAGMRLGDCADVRIFAVHADGTETPLPTYEEALISLYLIREEVQKAIDAQGPAKGMTCGLPELVGCSPSALRAILRMLPRGAR